jgi:transposase-like protein
VNIHKNARSTPYSRLQMARQVEHGEKAAKVAVDFCVSEQTVRKWTRRWRAGGEIALQDRSSTPGRGSPVGQGTTLNSEPQPRRPGQPLSSTEVVS